MPILFIVLIFVAWLGYEIKKSSRESAADSKKFWERESEALMTPRKAISDINFIEIPEEIIPTILTPNDSIDELTCEDINALTEELRTLSSQRIADLSEYTNTDLRLKYGSPNFTELSNADSNYTRLVQLMPLLIRRLHSANLKDSAKKLLDFCDEKKITGNELKKLHSLF